MALRLPAAGEAERRRQLGLLALLGGWLGYTYSFPWLSRFHATLPACPFFVLTGHPCPFCGGTRAFAAVWQGDLARAVRLYPLAPLLFLGALLAAAGLLALAVSGRSLPPVEMRLRWRLAFLAAAVLCLQWGLKLAWLGN